MHPNRHAIAFGSLVFLVVSIVLIIAALFWGWPKYKVYKKEMDGIAALKEAEWSKQILIEEAKAREQAALMQAKARVTLAQAEGEAKIVQAKAEGLADIERAKAAAEANRIIGESLNGMKSTFATSGLKAFKMEMVNAFIFLLKLAFQYSKRVRQGSNAPLLGNKG